MSDAKAVRTVAVVNPQGLHARAATLIAETVRRFDARVVLLKGSEEADGHDVLQILSLGAAQGESLDLRAIGREAEAAVDALTQLITEDLIESDQDGNGDGDTERTDHLN